MSQDITKEFIKFYMKDDPGNAIGDLVLKYTGDVSIILTYQYVIDCDISPAYLKAIKEDPRCKGNMKITITGTEDEKKHLLKLDTIYGSRSDNLNNGIIWKFTE